MKNNRIQMILLSAVALSFSCLSYSETQLDNKRETPMEPRMSVITLGVADLKKSFVFYKEGLRFPTKMTPDGGIIVFATSGTRLVLYPQEKLAEDVGLPALAIEKEKNKFPGFTLGHCARNRKDVDAILSQAERAGGRIVKSARDVFWGGYSGYFSDPDGYLWEVAYSDQWKFNPDGSMVLEE